MRPSGTVTFLMSDIGGSTRLLRVALAINSLQVKHRPFPGLDAVS